MLRITSHFVALDSRRVGHKPPDIQETVQFASSKGKLDVNPDNIVSSAVPFLAT